MFATRCLLQTQSRTAMHAPALQQRLLTADEYYAMVRAGILDEDDRTELLDGKIIAMTAAGGPHIACVNRLTRLFVSRTDPSISVSVQNPVRLHPYWVPEPDVALLHPADNDQIPTADQVLLVVEVADTSLEKDRAVKVPQYAAAGIPEVWIVALNEGYVEVHRRPMGDGYGETRRYLHGEDIEHSTFPALGTVAVDDVLGG